MSNETIGQRLRRVRKERGMFASDVARRVRCNPSTITLMERDLHGMSIFTFADIARVLDVSLDYLAYGDVVDSS